jgi:hypothetical protein
MRVKDVARKMVPRSLFRVLKEAIYPEKIGVLENRLGALFLTYYKDVASPTLAQKVALKNAEFKVHSKHGCDGLLLYIFSKIGVTNYTFVEMGIENGRECNTANLALNFGWNGLLIDANKEWVLSAQKYYDEQLGSMKKNVRVAECFVTAESITPLLDTHHVRGEIDLLSIDIDSNDYFVWKSITTINPRVVVIEYNASFGLHSITMKYNPEFHFQEVYKEAPLYFGASLPALTKLGKEKGYRLIGCDTNGHDAYFVRNDIAEGIFTELSPEEAFYANPLTIRTIGNLETQYNMVKDMPFDHI